VMAVRAVLADCAWGASDDVTDTRNPRPPRSDGEPYVAARRLIDPCRQHE
jgi:hypothetical protein